MKFPRIKFDPDETDSAGATAETQSDTTQQTTETTQEPQGTDWGELEKQGWTPEKVAKQYEQVRGFRQFQEQNSDIFELAKNGENVKELIDLGKKAKEANLSFAVQEKVNEEQDAQGGTPLTEERIAELVAETVNNAFASRDTEAESDNVKKAIAESGFRIDNEADAKRIQRLVNGELDDLTATEGGKYRVATNEDIQAAIENVKQWQKGALSAELANAERVQSETNPNERTETGADQQGEKEWWTMKPSEAKDLVLAEAEARLQQLQSG